MKDKPLATLELVSEGETPERVVSFFESPAGAAGTVAEVTGRPEPMLVDRAVLDDLRRAAAALHDAAMGKPKESGKAKTATKTAPSPAPGAARTVPPPKKK